MLTQLVAAIFLSQVPAWSNSHLETQKFKWEQAQKLDRVRLEFILSVNNAEGASSQHWKVWKSGKASNLELQMDGKTAFQFCTDGAVSYVVDFGNKKYYEVPVTEPGEAKFELPPVEEGQIDFKFENLWFYINASKPLTVKKVVEEKIDGRSFVVVDYTATNDTSRADVTEWIDPKSGLVHRFGIRVRSEEHGFQAIDGWISQLDMKDATNLSTVMFKPADHPDFSKGN